jgi:[acyl-carrier-protein] S-malonyltransferase
MSENCLTAFAYPGMGIRMTGFERAVFIRHRKKMLPFFEQAAAAATVDLVGLIEQDAAQCLDDRNSQLFTFAFSSALSDIAFESGIVPQYAAGYSFGLYAALYAVRALPFSAVLACASFAFNAMREACVGNTWGMAAIIGLSLPEVKELVRDSLVVVNVNSDACVIVAGLRHDLDALCLQARDRQAIKAEFLPVGIPYHSPAVLALASEKLREYCSELPWQRPRLPLVSSIDASLLTEASQVREQVIRHICTPISWKKTVAWLKSLGVTRIIECGPGVSLSRHGQFMPFDISYVNIKNIKRCCGL